MMLHVETEAERQPVDPGVVDGRREDRAQREPGRGHEQEPDPHDAPLIHPPEASRDGGPAAGGEP